MKKFILPTIVLLASTLGTTKINAQALASFQEHTPAQTIQSREFSDVPANHWAYPALKKLIEMGQIDGVTVNIINQPLTYYEFGVATLRWLDYHPHIENPSKELQANDIIAAFEREFAPEMKSINDRVDSSGSLNVEGPTSWIYVQTPIPQRTLRSPFLQLVAQAVNKSESDKQQNLNDSPDATISIPATFLRRGK